MAAGQKSVEQPDNPVLAPLDPGLGIHVGFSTTGAWYSRMIRWAIGAKVSHCFVVYHSAAFGREMVLEASSQGFRVLAWSRFDKENKLVALYRMDLPEPVAAAAMEKLSEKLGDSYDFMIYIGYLLRRFLRLKWTPFDSKDKLVCSEALVLFFEWVGVPIPETKGMITPQDLLAVAEARGDLFTLIDTGRGFGKAAKRASRRVRRHKFKLERCEERPPNQPVVIAPPPTEGVGSTDAGADAAATPRVNASADPG